MYLNVGIVFLVQQILVFFPTFFTKRLVLVAIPEIWLKKLSATLSPIRIFCTLPSIVAMTSFFLTTDPSFFLALNLICLSIKIKVYFAKSNPAIIPF